MKQKQNKLIIPALLIGTGAALYFLNKSGKLDKLKNLIKGTTTPEIENPTAVVIGPGTTTTTANPLGNIENVKDFQKFFNGVRPLVMLPLEVDGIFGPKTAAAYNSYKDQYNNRIDKSIKKFYE